MKKKKKKKFKKRTKVRKKIKKKIPKINLKKEKRKTISKQEDQPKKQNLFQPLINAYEKFREKQKIEKSKQVNISGKVREKKN